MCASNAEHTAVVPLDVPEACKPGDRVWFGPSYDRDPVPEINTKKSKLLELILKDCVTDAGELFVWWWSLLRFWTRARACALDAPPLMPPPLRPTPR
jgi:hypothetical protein